MAPINSGASKVQSEERQMAQRWFVAAKPMSFEKNVTNVSCRYGQNI